MLVDGCPDCAPNPVPALERCASFARKTSDARATLGSWTSAPKLARSRTSGQNDKCRFTAQFAEAFVDFVKSRGSGPLFYDPAKRRAGARKPQAKIVAKRVANWVHTLGLKVGKGDRKAPNHAWRHFFRTLARDAKVADSVASAILGHRPATVGEGYGETRLDTKSNAIESMGLAELLGATEHERF